MALPILNTNRPLPIARQRDPQANIPQTLRERETIKRAIEYYVADHNIVMPMSINELREHAHHFCQTYQWDPVYQNYIAVLINNEGWREQLAAIPYERRLLLLPKCLRDESRCPAPFDEFGLLCKQCGLCSIQDLEQEAESLGYAVLVAEGSAVVMSIIETGKIEAIVGVSCLNVLERAFPYMEAAAIPGISIPLLQDDCADCTVDLNWVWDVVHLSSDDKTHRLDLDALRETVQSWFAADALNQLMGAPQGEAEKVGREWLLRSGKRWRPYLAVCAHQALQENPGAEIPEGLKKVAVAVECFHKASLIHDDIEDDDGERYGEPTLHEEHGMAVALNVGDLLLGEGYRLIAESGASPSQIAAMLKVAADGQRHLCQGQGAELAWTRNPQPLDATQVLEIFRQKTAPAFEVALRLGSIYANGDLSLRPVIEQYSEALGIAYQIRDDIDDWPGLQENPDVEALRPNILLAMAHERAKGALKEELASVWKRETAFNGMAASLNDSLKDAVTIEERGRRLMEAYKQQAIDSLKTLENASFKGLLRRVIGKIFNEIEIQGWCKEFEAQNRAQQETSQTASAS